MKNVVKKVVKKAVKRRVCQLALLLAILAQVAAAQCVMCFRTAAAQQIERARVLNLGIIVMLIPPFLVLGFFLYLLYCRRGSFADGDTETPVERN
ncbi:MAG: hypothetical protein ACRD8O_23360 [Bryobacteraceae bacterium]